MTLDPWHIIELLVLGIIGLAWRTLDTRISESRAKIHNLEGQVALLAQANVRSEERDKSFTDTMDRLGRALDRFDTKVDELSKIVGVARKFSPPTGFRAVKPPLPREEPDE